MPGSPVTFLLSISCGKVHRIWGAAFSVSLQLEDWRILVFFAETAEGVTVGLERVVDGRLGGPAITFAFL